MFGRSICVLTRSYHFRWRTQTSNFSNSIFVWVSCKKIPSILNVAGSFRISGTNYRRDCVAVRASATPSVDLKFISHVQSHVAQMEWRGEQPASSLVVSLGKALNGVPSFLCGRQVAKPSSQLVVLTQSN